MRIILFFLCVLTTVELSSQAFSIVDPTFTGLAASVASTTNSETDIATDASLLGGELDLVVTNSNGGSFIDYFEGIIDMDSDTEGSVILEWDGIDGDATTTSFSTMIADLGSCGDFTINLNSTNGIALNIDVTIEMYNSATQFISITDQAVLAPMTTTAYTVNTSAFQATGPSFDFNNLTALRIIFPNLSGVDFSIVSIAWVPDVSANADCDPIADPNEPTCEITSIVSDPICDDNGTPFDPTDDTYSFNATINGTDAGMTWTASDGTTGSFGVEETFGPYIIADGDVTITVTSDDGVDCNTVTLNIIAPATCSDDCEVTAVAGDPICDDNGTPLVLDDDTFTFSATVEGMQAGTSWTGDEGTTGNYGVETAFGPFNFIDGDATIIITSDINPDCSFTLVVAPPEPCSLDVDPAGIPTMGQWGIMILGLCTAVFGLVFIRKRETNYVQKA